jgi:hypothetical protein
VGVVLAALEHAPEQDRELAGGRDDRLAVPAPRARAVIEGVQRARLKDDAPGGFDQRPARRGGPAFADPAAARRRVPGLADLRIQAEIGDQLAAGEEPADVSPMAAMNVDAQIKFTPGTVINRRISGHSSACWAISRSTAATSPSRTSM